MISSEWETPTRQLENGRSERKSTVVYIVTNVVSKCSSCRLSLSRNNCSPISIFCVSFHLLSYFIPLHIRKYHFKLSKDIQNYSIIHIIIYIYYVVFVCSLIIVKNLNLNVNIYIYNLCIIRNPMIWFDLIWKNIQKG